MMRESERKGEFKEIKNKEEKKSESEREGEFFKKQIKQGKMETKRQGEAEIKIY